MSASTFVTDNSSRLERLMGYIKHTINYGMEGFVGDKPEDCSVLVYSDASFADELATSKSTSGFFGATVGYSSSGSSDDFSDDSFENYSPRTDQRHDDLIKLPKQQS